RASSPIILTYTISLPPHPHPPHPPPLLLPSTPILFFFFNHPATPAIYTLSLHDALPIFVLVALTLQVANALAHSHKALGLGFALLQALPLAFRRRWPVLVLAFVAAGAFGAAVVPSGGVPFPLPLFIAVFTLASHAAPRRPA